MGALPELLTIDRGDVLTAEEAAALLKLRKSTVLDLARRGRLPSIKLGRHVRFIRGDLADALTELRQPQRSTPRTRE